MNKRVIAWILLFAAVILAPFGTAYAEKPDSAKKNAFVFPAGLQVVEDDAFSGTAVETLVGMGVIPIVNENDTIAIDELELEIGENDSLSALVAELSGADLLLILSDIDGLYTDDPRTNPDAEPIHVVEVITPEIEAMAGGAGTSLGTGGMSTKINAAKIATEAGIDMVIMNGRDPEKLYDLFEDAEIGTLFKANK